MLIVYGQNLIFQHLLERTEFITQLSKRMMQINSNNDSTSLLLPSLFLMTKSRPQ
mgnify:CR=1